jgi:hypothetical protein
MAVYKEVVYTNVFIEWEVAQEMQDGGSGRAVGTLRTREKALATTGRWPCWY